MYLYWPIFLCFKMAFCLFSLLQASIQKNGSVSWIRTRTVGVENKHAGHLTISTLWPRFSLFGRELKKKCSTLLFLFHSSATFFLFFLISYSEVFYDQELVRLRIKRFGYTGTNLMGTTLSCHVINELEPSKS